tara:strand:- start:4612 stop:5184 length:573 start_codon:yes stop_codon:yes gene_type:complete
MSDGKLKKGFSKPDVTRLRNLIQGKSGERTTSGTGYSKAASDKHQEGDIWEESGRSWTIKNGIKENITKLDKFKSLTIPLFCPKCTKIMDKQLDPNYYKSYGECLSCRTEFETKLKIEGKWQEHTRNAHNLEIDHLIEEYKQFYADKLQESNQGFVTEAGDVEKWVGGINKDSSEESLNSVIEYLEGLKN